MYLNENMFSPRVHVKGGELRKMGFSASTGPKVKLHAID